MCVRVCHSPHKVGEPAHCLEEPRGAPVVEVEWREVVAVGEVEGERGCSLAVVVGLPHGMDLGDGEVDGLPALWRGQELEGGEEGREGREEVKNTRHPTLEISAETPNHTSVVLATVNG